MMLNLSTHSISTEIEQIDNIDSKQLYDNVAEVYNFWDKKFDELGDEKDTLAEVNEKFYESSLYRDDYMDVSFLSLNVDTNGERILEVEISLLHDKKTEIYYFGHHYFEDYFLGEEFRVDVKVDVENIPVNLFLGEQTTIPFKVLSIEELIKKRLYLIKQYLLFKENKQYRIHSDPPSIMCGIYRKLDIADGIFESEGKMKRKLSIRMKYLIRELAKLGEVERLNGISEAYKVKLVQGEINIIQKNSYDRPGTRNYSVIENYNHLPRGIHLEFFDMEIEATEKIFEEVNTILEKIEFILKEEKKIEKLLKSISQTLFLVLSSPEKEIEFMERRTNILITAYKKLIEKGETYYAPMIVDLLYVVLDDLGSVSDSIPYLKHGGYNKLLKSIKNKNKGKIMKYMDRRMLALYSSEPGLLEERLERLALLYNNFGDEESLYIFDRVIKHGYEKLITINHIEYFLDNLKDENKIYFINNLIIELGKYTSFSIEDGTIVGLEIYNHIFNYPVSDEVKDGFEEVVSKIISDYIKEYPNLINGDFTELLKISGADKYILDIDSFEDKYFQEIYNTYYLFAIREDKDLIGKKEIDFDKYKNLDKIHLEKFLEKVLFTDVFYQIHKNKKIKNFESVEWGQKIWYLLEVIAELEYPDHIYDIVLQLEDDNIIKYYDELEYALQMYENDELTVYTHDERAIIAGLPLGVDNVGTSKYKELTESEAFRIMKHQKRITEDMQMRLATHPSIEVRKELAKQQNLKGIVQEKIGRDDKIEVVIAYLETKRVEWSKPALERIAEHWSPMVREKLAEREDLNYDIQVKLVKEEEDNVLIKYLTTKKKNRSNKALEIIAGTADREPCIVLLDKIENLTEKVQINLAKHRSVDVRAKLAKRQKLAWIVQKRIGGDDKEEVVITYLEIKRTERSEFALEIIAEHWSPIVREKLAEREDLNFDTQVKLAKSDEDNVLIKYLTIKKRNRSNKALEIIAGTADREPCIVLLDKIENLTEQVQVNLANHRSVDVRAKLAKRQKLDWRVQKKIGGDDKEEVLITYLETKRIARSEFALERIAEHWSPIVREKLAEREDLNFDTQVKLAKSDEDNVLIKYLTTKKKNRSNKALEIIAGTADREPCIVLLDKIENLTEQVQINLANHRSVDVRAKLARRQNLAWIVQKRIGGDDKEEVVITYLEIKRSSRSEVALEKISEHWSSIVREKLAERKDINHDTQVKLAKSTEDRVLIKYLTTKKINRSIKSLQLIAKKADEEPCIVMMDRIQKLPINILETLTNHRSKKVVAKAQKIIDNR